MPTGPLLANSGLAFGLLSGTIGLNALLRPVSGLQLFQFPLPTDPSARRTALGLMRIYASRNVTIGLIFLALWSYSQFAVMGWACLAGCLMTLTDGFVARAVIRKGEWTHWAFTPVGVVLGVAFLGSEGVF